MIYRRPTGNGLCVGTHRDDPDRPRQAVDGRHLCQPCHDQADRQLARIPSLLDDLERALIPGNTGTHERVSGSSGEGPVPWNERAGDAHRNLLGWLHDWTRIIAEERGHHLPDDLSPRSLATWQRQQLAVWTDAQPWVDEWASNLRANVAAGRGAIAGQRRKTITVGACPDHDRCDVDTRTLVRCTGSLQAIVDLDETWPEPTVVGCDQCGREHLTGSLATLGKRLGERAWLTTGEAATLLGLDPSRIRHMAAEHGWRRREREGIRPARWDADDVTTRRVQASA